MSFIRYNNPKILETFNGSLIKAIYVDETKQYLFLQTDDGRFHGFHTEGDCCSISWIEHLTIRGQVIGEYIYAVTGSDLDILKEAGIENPAHPEWDEGSQILQYSTMFHANNGILEIEYRNESNGYYGGSLEYIGSKMETPPNLHLNLITEDF